MEKRFLGLVEVEQNRKMTILKIWKETLNRKFESKALSLSSEGSTFFVLSVIDVCMQKVFRDSTKKITIVA